MKTLAGYSTRELRRQRSKANYDLRIWQEKSDAKVKGYLDKMEQLDSELAQREKTENK